MHGIENNEIAYAGSTPWHGLGHSVERGTTGKRMLEIAKLNYPVLLEDVIVNGKVLPQYKAIVRGDNGKVFSIQSDRYQPVQNEEIVDLFAEYCEAGHATMETVGAIRGGAIVWALARLNGDTKMTLAGDDQVEGYILFSSAHDGTLPTIGMPTQKRVVCQNTFNAALRANKSKAGFRMKHSTKWTPERATEAKEVLGIAIEDCVKFNELSAKLSNVTIDDKGRFEFISQLMDGKYLLEEATENAVASASAIAPTGDFLMDAITTTQRHMNAPVNFTEKLNRVGNSILDAILDSPGSDLTSAKNTLWGAVNGVSYYTDHVASRTQDSRLYNAWFGTAQQLKESAIAVASNMAGI